jgi:hypothetical protein
LDEDETVIEKKLLNFAEKHSYYCRVNIELAFIATAVSQIESFFKQCTVLRFQAVLVKTLLAQKCM